MVDWAGWAIFGVVATAALTSVLVAAQMTGLTRLDLPLLLGLVLADDPDRARAAGMVLHLGVGQGFAFGYACAFAVLDASPLWLGALLGGLHGFVALGVIVPLVASVHPRVLTDRAGRSSRPGLEPPGPLASNYGHQTAVITVAAHLAFGVALAASLTPA